LKNFSTAQTGSRRKISTNVRSWEKLFVDSYAQPHNDVYNFTEKLQNGLIFEEKKDTFDSS